MSEGLAHRPPAILVDEPLAALRVALGGFFVAFLLLASVFGDFFTRVVGITPASLLLGLLLVLVVSRCGPDPFHPARLLAVGLGLSFVLGPIVHALSGRYVLPDGSARQIADLPQAEWIILAGALLAFSAMKAVLGKSWAGELRKERRTMVTPRTAKAGVCVAVFGFAALVAYFFATGISSISLQGRGGSYAVIPHEGRRAYLALVAPVGIGGILILATHAFERRSRLVLAISGTAGVLYGAMLALPGSRANLLYAVAPLVFLYFAYRRVPRSPWLVASAIALLLVLFYGASLRSAATRTQFVHDPIGALAKNGPRPARFEDFFLTDVAHTEPFLAAMDAYPASRPFLGGESVALGFTGPAGWKLAKAIGLSPDPPVGVTSTATAYARDPSTFGSGLTATLPGELYANAGVLGVLLGLAGLGAVAGAIRRRAITSAASGSLTLYAVQLTLLFAIFADYIGQFYRVGAVLAGVAASLIFGAERELKVRRAGVIVALIVALSIALLLAVRFSVEPPPGLLSSMIPAYGILAATSLALVLRFSATRRRAGRAVST